MARKIVIDTDPGQDDAVAILLALASPELDVLGVTAVAGNVPLDLTGRNARIVCELAGRRDIPVFAGCDRPMARDLVTAEHVHGKTGLDGAELPSPAMPLQDAHAVDFLIETLRREPSGTVTLCPLGPLTNVATALERAPDIADRIPQIVLMGGAYFEVGNITPAAEFNIYVDPEAARIVFASGQCRSRSSRSTARMARLRRGNGTRVSRRLDAWARSWPAGRASSSGSTGRNTAPRARRSTTPA